MSELDDLEQLVERPPREVDGRAKNGRHWKKSLYAALERGRCTVVIRAHSKRPITLAKVNLPE